jgi:serine/threonine protein kinase
VGLNRRRSYGYASDFWSLGIVACNLFGVDRPIQFQGRRFTVDNLKKIKSSGSIKKVKREKFLTALSKLIKKSLRK